MDIALQSDEDSEQFHILLADLREEHQPQGPTEDILVFKMAEHFWFSRRSSILLAEQLDFNDDEDNKGQISLMLRYHTTADRGFIRSLNELRKLQKERRLEEIGFVSQNTETGPEASPAPPAEPAAVVANDAKTIVNRPVPPAEMRLRPVSAAHALLSRELQEPGSERLAPEIAPNHLTVQNHKLPVCPRAPTQSTIMLGELAHACVTSHRQGLHFGVKYLITRRVRVAQAVQILASLERC